MHFTRWLAGWLVGSYKDRNDPREDDAPEVGPALPAHLGIQQVVPHDDGIYRNARQQHDEREGIARDLRSSDETCQQLPYGAQFSWMMTMTYGGDHLHDALRLVG